MALETGDSVLINRKKVVSKTASAARIFALPSLVALDSVAILTGFFTAFYLRDPLLSSLFPNLFPERLLTETFGNIWWFPLVVLFCLFYENLYQKRLPFWIEVEQILKATTLAVVFAVALLYMSKTAFEVSRTLVAIIWLMLAITLPLFRYYGKHLLVKAGVWTRPVLIIGAGKTACLITTALQRERTLGYEVIGFLNDRGDSVETVKSAPACHIPILGDVAQAEKIIKTTKVQDVFLAMPALSAAETVSMVNRLQPLVSNIFFIPDLFGLAMSGIEAQHFFEEQVLMLNIKNRLKPLINRAVKRTFDLICGSFLLLLCTPVFLITAAAIKVNSNGPVFYNGRRIGQQGNNFSCHKFRTMHINSAEILQKHLAKDSAARQEWEEYRKLKSFDPRVTKVGLILRRFSLDELPQLLNVIAGEMSLVGPRPYLPDEKEQMGNWFEDILVAKPGITGLWQVSGRNLISFEGRLKLGAWYVKNWSLWLDIIIILRTLKVVIRGEGAY